MQASNILFRCSSLGHIMTEAKEKAPLAVYNEAVERYKKLQLEYAAIPNKESRSAVNKLNAILKASQAVNTAELNKDTPHLSKGCKTHLIDKYVSVKYGRQSDIQNKYTTKGLQVEEASLTLYARYKKAYDHAIVKNETTLSNDWICGTPDHFKGKLITEASHIVDIKSSWDIFTFFRSGFGDLYSLYYWQLQGYMDLTGAQSATLAYCLVDTPDQLINDEKRKLLWKMGVTTDQDPDYLEACVELEKRMIYTDIPISERVFEIPIERNQDDIDRMHKRVEDCRKYMETHLFNPTT